MSEYTSPVPPAGPDTPAPEPYREFYPMPMFVNIPTADFAASKDFWMRGLGFIDLFSIPDQLTHLRRWAFQDVLLVPGEPAEEAPAISVSFACVMNEVDGIAARCEEIAPGSVTGPAETPWNTIDATIVTPEGARVVMTAAKPLDRDGEKGAAMREMGFDFV
ncbi:VOC family protein [Glycomyces tenuis]|uniref:VOC family protein n=1 Tax=Glycomyces tenuis TaxID=58116 RepID=UPI0004018C34|nr:VOC family protein [Glycomyces tenuis]